jgi:uncharacterized membrane protein (UPF0127 family)
LTRKPTSHSQSGLIARNRSKGNAIIALHVIWAGSSAERRRGLLGRDALASDEGIYLVPCEWVHTFGMRFPIDIAFLHRSGRILSVHHALKPRRLSKLVFRADGVLELAAGRLHETQSCIGDVIEFEDPPSTDDLTNDSPPL